MTAVSGKDRVGTRTRTTFVCNRTWREFDFGTFLASRSYTEDDGNYYLHDYIDEYPAGFHSNYLTLPKHSWGIADG